MNTSLGPWWGGGRRGGGFDWFGGDLWDPFDMGRSWSWDRQRSGGAGEGRGGEDANAALIHVHMDWCETPEAHIIKADLPGVKKDEVKVQLEEENVLQISGERKEEKENANDKWHRVERRRGSFMRRFRLPESANVDAIKSVLEDGVLIITIPKKETHQALPKVRPINIS